MALYVDAGYFEEGYTQDSVSVDWGTKEIFVPKTFLTLVQTTPTEVYNLPINDFRVALKDLEDNADGMTFLDTHRHNTEVLLGGIVYARVFEIINGYTITFENGFYAVNLVGANSNIGDNINLNNVSVRSANSAGLISSQDIEYSSFNGGVTIDVDKGYAGTLYPIGTDRKKSNNTTDALLIAKFRGFNTLFIHSNLTIDSGLDYSGMVFQGKSHSNTVVQILDSANVSDVAMSGVNVEGILDGGTELDSCQVGNLVFFNGHIHASALYGTIYMGGEEDALILRSIQLTPEIVPTIDMLASTQNLVITEYTGEISIVNLQNVGSKVAIGLSSGSIILDSTTCTGGIVEAIGIGDLSDENGNAISTGIWNNGVIIKNKLLNKNTIAEATTYNENIFIDPTSPYSGTEDPVGIERVPVNNLADAVVLAAKRGTSRLFFMSDYTFTPSDVIFNFQISGNDNQQTTLTFEPGCVLAYCDFHNLHLTGSIAGLIGMTRCVVDNLGSVGLAPSSQTVTVRDTEINGLITFPTNYSGKFLVNNSYSGLSVLSYPILDFGGSTASLVVRNWSGQLELKGLSQGNIIDISMSAGEIELDPLYVTNCNIHITGTGRLLDESTGLEILSGIWNGNVIVENETVTGNGGSGGLPGVWTQQEKEESLAWSRKASDNAEQANLKLSQ